MGSGAAKQHPPHPPPVQSVHSQVIATPRLQEPLSVQTSIAQPQMPIQAQGFSHYGERTEEMTSEQAKVEWQVSHTATLNTYMLSYPELSEKLQTMFNSIETLRNFADSSFNKPKEYAKLGEMLEGLFNISYNIYTSAGTSDADQFTTLVDFVIDIEGAEVLQRLTQYCFKDYYEFEDEPDEDDSDKGSVEYTCFDCLTNVLATIQNFADFHNGFCSACADASVIPMCLENIQRIDSEIAHWENEDEDSEAVQIVDSCTGILHNISRRLRDPELFANSEEILLHFAKIKMPSIAATSLLCLAYLVNEETNHLILADENLLSFIIEMLNEAWQSEDRRTNGFSAKELAEGLSYIAINDTNKKVLGNKEAVQVLMSVIKTSREDEEKASAIRALWMLAFDDNNKEAIRQLPGALGTLRELQHSTNPEVQKAAAGAIWELEGKTSRSAGKDAVSGNHVMISYQWDNQEVLIEVKNRLQDSGYRVWMDLEQMGGSTLEAMAKAVENSSVVLVCVSQRYKESPNCRSEAEYAYQLRKDIIPLMMQHKYKADGWLGMLVGTKLWIDFHSKHVVEAGVVKLIRELGGRGKDGDVTDGPAEPVVRPVEAVAVASPPSSPVVSGWTNKEVKQWLKEIGLEKVCKEDISKMDGQTLIELQELRGECPDYFYKCVEQNLKLTDMFDLLKFRKELSKLLGY